MVKTSRLNDVCLEVFELQASPVEGQSLQQKEKKRRKRKGEKKISKIEKMKNAQHLRIQFSKLFPQSNKKSYCVGRESNSGQLLGRQLCSPLYHRRFDVGLEVTNNVGF